MTCEPERSSGAEKDNSGQDENTLHCDQHRSDVVVLDIELPGINGMDSEFGNLIDGAYLGTNNQPVLVKGGSARATFNYDEGGKLCQQNAF